MSGALAVSGTFKNDDLMFYALVVVQTIPPALIAISCHRIVLLGEASLPDPRDVYWTSRETRFLLWWVKATTDKPISTEKGPKHVPALNLARSVAGHGPNPRRA